MDVLTDLLQRARAEGGVFASSTFRAPWGLALEDRPSLSVHVALEGSTWLCLDGTEPVQLHAGDLAFVAATVPHRLGSSPRARAMSLAAAQRHLVAGTVATYDVPGTGPISRVLCGAYRLEGELGTYLLDAVPPVVVVRRGDAPALSALVDVLAVETVEDGPGRAVVLDRLLDVVFVHVLRRCWDRTGTDAPRWYRALSDPEVRQALRLLHGAPAHPWTVATLAREVGVSRATLARRFAAALGTSPMSYLTGWRMRIAAEQLRGTALAVGHIASSVGYHSDAAFTAAFRRHHGTTPTAYRAAVRHAA